ncbi:hypothetical protein BU23DRAFT_57588 [Bimuria novae-zelandiae CBS 107.79]|uniref:Uncharacterized protein n=1 Tax=Bimuria novae-zelandiae CBS 107.79 TaxID=1447943 RepID=A0A6A5VGW8_9PLEO|nr:hypothetical protein BU23DRAFT_57588 [Bimuria novae-zelandiae CBS 107.79]
MEACLYLIFRFFSIYVVRLLSPHCELKRTSKPRSYPLEVSHSPLLHGFKKHTHIPLLLFIHYIFAIIRNLIHRYLGLLFRILAAEATTVTLEALVPEKQTLVKSKTIDEEDHMFKDINSGAS